MEQQIIIQAPVSVEQFSPVINWIRDAHHQVYSYANRALINLYWQIGQYLSEQTQNGGWGKSVVKSLSEYIQQTEPGAEGFSAQNLWRMKQFYETYCGNEKLSTLLRDLSWSNNLLIMNRCKTDEEREYYLRTTKQEHWSYRTLDRQISAGVFERAMLGQAGVEEQNEKLSTLVRDLPLKDSYIFEFLHLPAKYDENDLRAALKQQMKQFILELGGRDFVYMGDEFAVQVGLSDFRLDLLFYHRTLQCLVDVELKVDKFRPEHLGQLNFYLEALDRDVKKPCENPSIGILLCKDKDDEVVEYAMNRSLSPAMVAEYQLQLPDKKLLQAKMQELFQHQN